MVDIVVDNVCCRNFLKIPGTADFRRKMTFLEFLELYFIFFHEIWHTLEKWQYLKCDGARFSKNIFFRPKMPEIYRKNRFLGIFSRFYHQFFLIFCSKMHIRIAQNMAQSDFSEKFFSGQKSRKYTGNRRFCRFSSDFFLYFVVFSHKHYL